MFDFPSALAHTLRSPKPPGSFGHSKRSMVRALPSLLSFALQPSIPLLKLAPATNVRNFNEDFIHTGHMQGLKIVFLYIVYY